jgi:hypothetical protein
MMEKTYERQNEQHLGPFSPFDEICLESETYPDYDELIARVEQETTLYGLAAGDFTLASATAWHKLYGYPEVKNNHLDGLQLCRFFHLGLKQIVFRPKRPCSAIVFHQRHESGRDDRKEQNIGPIHSRVCVEEKTIEERLAVFINKEDWGWHKSQRFEEDALTFFRNSTRYDFEGVSCHYGKDSRNCTTQKAQSKGQTLTGANVGLKNVISFSLYGNKDRYYDGAIENAYLSQTIYPGWEVYYYHDNSVPNEALVKLASFSHVRLFNMSDSPVTNPMTWRFLVALNPDVSAYIFRDVDSRLNHREKAAVMEWLEQSNATFHVMHDHPGHCGMPIQGGMWGGRALVPEIDQVVYPNKTSEPITTFQHWDDTNRLRDIIWPIVKLDLIHHDSYCCGKFNETIKSRPFPTPRVNGTGEHVGSVYLPILSGKLRDRDKNAVLREKECNK